ncbi:MAG: hypothetical protein HYZ42_01180 [Bacteroidetes bacterium]|nr:hypothetical protein [Bacteroidota bacterium]
MTQNILINQLELAYSPVSNYDFNFLKLDMVIQEILSDSRIYIITQRPILSFENIVFSEEEAFLRFEIHQKNNPEVLKVLLPFFQENIARDKEKVVEIEIGSIDKDNDLTQRPINNMHGIKFYQDKVFHVWFSPEKFIHNYTSGEIQAEVLGDIRKFTKYSVHYVGKATEQSVWNRLTGHSTLQEILSVEYPLVYGSLPTHEIAILFLRFKDNLSIKTYGDSLSDIDEIMNTLMGQNQLDQKTIFLDAEKALIKAMQPKYNKEVYKSYPKSKDGLFKHNLTLYSYTFTDPISLIYEEGAIDGGLNFLGGDTIQIANNTMRILKAN